MCVCYKCRYYICICYNRDGVWGLPSIFSPTHALVLPTKPLSCSQLSHCQAFAHAVSST